MLMPGYPQDGSAGRAGLGARPRGVTATAALHAGGRPGGPRRHRRDALLQRHRLQARPPTIGQRLPVPLHRPQQQGERRRRSAAPTRSATSTRRSSTGQRGTYFVDKPWIAVDVPRAGAAHLHHPRGSAGPSRAGAIYVAWVRFSRATDRRHHVLPLPRLRQDLERADQAERPELAEPGASVLAVDPFTGFVYVAWRRFGDRRPSPQQTEDAILAARSFSGGEVHQAARGPDLHPLRPGPARPSGSAPRPSPPSPSRWTRPAPGAGSTSPGRSGRNAATGAGRS